MEKVTLDVKLLSIGEQREVETHRGIKHNLVEGNITDETAEMNMTVWNESIPQLEAVKPGDDLRLKNCFISSFRGDLSVNIGRESTIEKR